MNRVVCESQIHHVLMHLADEAIDFNVRNLSDGMYKVFVLEPDDEKHLADAIRLADAILP